MIYKETKPCDICGEYYPTYQLERMFTGRTIMICYKCRRKGLTQTGARLNWKKAKGERNE